MKRAMIIGSDVSTLMASFAVGTSAAQLLFTPAESTRSQIEFSCWPNEFIPAAIPALAKLLPARAITVRPSGSREQWADKVGNPAKIFEMFPLEPTTFAGYTAGEFFGTLLPLMGGGVNSWDMSKDSLDAVIAHVKPDVIINTAPRALFCSKLEEHGFPRRSYWLSTQITPHIEEGEIVVNSEDAPAWYTTSKFDGVQYTKWLIKPPFSAVSEQSFPISTNCDCAPHGMVHVGIEAECNPLVTLADVYSSAAAAVL